MRRVSLCTLRFLETSAICAGTTRTNLPADSKVASDLEDFFSRYAVDTTGRMATINSFLKVAFPHLVFVGFYTVREPGAMLQIGPYQGPVLATGLIAFGKGVCGTAAESRVTQIVADVSTCANYIPCDDVTRSEIVVPVWGRVLHGEAGSEAPAVPAAADASAAAEGAAAPAKKVRSFIGALEASHIAHTTQAHPPVSKCPAHRRARHRQRGARGLRRRRPGGARGHLREVVLSPHICVRWF